MKNLIALTLLLLLSAQLFAQSPAADTTYNLGFEDGKPGDLPRGWEKFNTGNGYKIQLTSQEKHSGDQSLLIEQTLDKGDKAYASVVTYIPAKYIGKEVELRAYLKCQDVTNLISMILRTDDVDGNILTYKSLQTQKISGTRDWQLYSVKTFLPPDAQKIMVGPILAGPGKLWVDDLQVLVDGKDIRVVKTDPDFNPNPPKRPKYGSNQAASGMVKLKDADIYYETYGNGQPLLLLHGNSQNIYAFMKQIPAFEKKYKVIAIDTRGQGKSTDRSTGPLSYDLFADDMRQLMDSLHIKKANIVGWSDGGNTGLVMAVKYPAYVKKLVTMGANLFPTNEALSDTVLNEVKQTIEKLKRGTDEWSKMHVRLFTMLLKEPHLTFKDMKKIKAPVLVMAGEHDLILEKHTQGIAEAIPKGKLVIFKGATHYAPVEIVREFNETVLNFL